MKKGILLIGYGNMGKSLYKGMLEVIPEEKIYVCERNEEQTKNLPSDNVTKDVNEFLDVVDTLILAVKPQAFEDLASRVETDISDKLIVSIMAGVSMEKISNELDVDKIVRTMPNLNIQVGSGLLGWMASDEVSDLEKDLLRELFSAFGEEVEVDDESMIDKITALSGSGPAYYFRLCELMFEKALEFGFSEEDANKIANSTFIGAGQLLEENRMSAKEWREAVTSKGGTTEAALDYMEKNNFGDIFRDAMEKAKERSEELNSG